MNICDDGHDEVCYEERDCPCCALLYDIDEIKREVDDLDSAVTELEGELTEANDYTSALEAEVEELRGGDE